MAKKKTTPKPSEKELKKVIENTPIVEVSFTETFEPIERELSEREIAINECSAFFKAIGERIPNGQWDLEQMVKWYNKIKSSSAPEAGDWRCASCMKHVYRTLRANCK